jgi:hypothetical protein
VTGANKAVHIKLRLRVPMRLAMPRLDPSDVERFKREDQPIGRIVWYSITAGCVGSGFAIGQLWTYVVGFPVAGVLALGGFSLHLRLHRARWHARFPDLRSENVRWRRT